MGINFQLRESQLGSLHGRVLQSLWKAIFSLRNLENIPRGSGAAFLEECTHALKKSKSFDSVQLNESSLSTWQMQTCGCESRNKENQLLFSSVGTVLVAKGQL